MKRLYSALFVACLLAGCGSDYSQFQDGYRQFPGLWHAITRPGKLPKAPVVIPNNNTAILYLSIPSQNWQASFMPVARRDGLIVWQAGQKASIATRSGVIISTRGLGDDLMSSDVDDLISVLNGSGLATGQRENWYLTGGNFNQQVIFICDYNHRQPNQLVEDCHGARENITNQYVVTQNGQAGRSQQWLGPYLGYADLEWGEQGKP